MSTRQEISTWIASAPDATTADNRIEMAIDALGLPKSKSLNVRRTALATFLRANPANETGWNIPGTTSPPTGGPTTPPPTPPTPVWKDVMWFDQNHRGDRMGDGPEYQVYYVEPNGAERFVTVVNAMTDDVPTKLNPTPAASSSNQNPPRPSGGNPETHESWWDNFYHKFDVRGGEHH